MFIHSRGSIMGGKTCAKALVDAVGKDWPVGLGVGGELRLSFFIQVELYKKG